MWGLLLRALPFLTRAGSFVKAHPIITLGGSLIAGKTLLSGKDEETQPTTQKQPTQQPTTQKQPTQQPTTQKQPNQTKPKPKNNSSNSPINLPPLQDVVKQLGGNPSQQQTDNSNEGGLSQIVNQIQDLFVDLDKHRQMYEVLSQQYLQANDIYEKQLLQTMQVIPFLMAKTPLNNMTTEDLNEHLNNLFTSMPYTDALEKVNHLTKGYYIAKMNGVDPKTLSTTDLTLIADNPALAKSVNDNLVQFLDQMGEILKYKIKSNMDKVGALKDQYQNILKELEEKGKLYKEIINAYKYEMQQGFNEYKFNTKRSDDWKKHVDTINEKEKNRALRKEEDEQKKQYQEKKLNIAERNLKLKEEKTKNGNKSGITEALNSNNNGEQ
jgi:hypothetical protein